MPVAAFSSLGNTAKGARCGPSRRDRGPRQAPTLWNVHRFAVGGPAERPRRPSSLADLLYGSPKAGKYQFDKVLTVSSKTADGVVRVASLGRRRMTARGVGGLLRPGAARTARRSIPGPRRAGPQPAMRLGLLSLTGGGRRRRQRTLIAVPFAGSLAAAPAAATPQPLQDFTVNAVGKDDKLDMALKGAYAANKYSVVATLAQTGKVRAGAGSSAGPACGQAAAQQTAAKESSRACSGGGGGGAARAVQALAAHVPGCGGSADGRACHRRLHNLAAMRAPCLFNVAQVAVAASYKELAPGLNVGVTGTVPDPDSGGWVGCGAAAAAWDGGATKRLLWLGVARVQGLCVWQGRAGCLAAVCAASRCGPAPVAGPGPPELPPFGAELMPAVAGGCPATAGVAARCCWVGSRVG